MTEPRGKRVFPTAWARTVGVRAVREVIQVVGLKTLMRVQLRLDVHGLDHLSALKGPAVIVANHASHLDTAVLLATLPRDRRRHTAVAAAADYFFDTWWRAVGSVVAFNTFPIARRGGSESATSGNLLSDGWSIVIYPEGTRSADGFVGRFRLGAAWLAIGNQVPVLPVGLRGTYAAMPRGRSWPVRGRPRVSVRYGTPIVPGPGETLRQLAPRISSAVQALIAEDATSWWSVQVGRSPASEPPRASWRRIWQQTESPVEGDRPQRPRVWRR